MVEVLWQDNGSSGHRSTQASAPSLVGTRLKQRIYMVLQFHLSNASIHGWALVAQSKSFPRSSANALQ